MTLSLFCAALVAALLSLYPAMSPGARECIAARQNEIAQDLADAAPLGVPPALYLAVGLFETHLGCDRASGGCWGAPVDRYHRHTAGAPIATARALAASLRVCGTWPRALARFRCGICAGCPRSGYRPAQVLSLASRLCARAGVDCGGGL